MNCDSCGERISGRYISIKKGLFSKKNYCSEKCYETSLPKCNVCSAAMKQWTVIDGKKYCSEECSKEAYPRCHACDIPMAEWITKYGNKYCSDTCSLEGRPTCEECGIPMDAWIEEKKHKFCSNECLGKFKENNSFEDGFWGKLGGVVTKAAETAINKYDELKSEVAEEERRLARRSPDDLMRIARSGTGAKKYAAMKLLKERGHATRKQPPTRPEPIDNKTTPAFRKGDRADIKTTIVLSAPGQEEEKAGRPAAKQTGKTLQKAIEELNKRDPAKFPSKNLDDYNIINAVEDVHYKGKTGRTEAYDSEIRNPENIKRLKKVLDTSDTVVALGDKARYAINEAQFRGKRIEGAHPSMSRLNSKYKSEKNTPGERNDDRIEQWVDDLMKSTD